jgi:hypothetical protein
MRKRITPSISVRSALHGEWLDLEGLAEIEVTSEHPIHPIEGALLPGMGPGWRAAQSGKQTLRITFDSPQDLRLIHLVFIEDQCYRTQEFVLRWAGAPDEPRIEIVRQQYNFTPTSSEVEDFAVELRGVKLLELEITPSIDGNGCASLAELRLC